MPRKPSPPFLLIAIFGDVWAQSHDGEEYQADGRDFREAKLFLEIHPDILEKQEMFRTSALKYMDDDFWRNHAYLTNHQFFHFAKNYSKYANAIRSVRKTRSANQDNRIASYLCSDCGGSVVSGVCGNRSCPTNQWKHEEGTPEAFQAKLNELTQRMKI